MTSQQPTAHQKDLTMPAPDGLSRFIGAGAWAAIVSGVALAASLLLEWLVVPYEQLGQTEAYLTGSYLLASGLRLFGTILLLWALLGIYERQSRAAGTFGLWAFVVAFLGTALLAGNVGAGNGSGFVSGERHKPLRAAVQHRDDPVRGGNVEGTRVSTLGVGTTDRL